jgi:cobalamin biosynthesis protein CobD/CbiB
LRQSYKTLFYGLKKNHHHNVAIVHPLSFLLRRIIYATVITFTTEDNAFFGALILLLTCIFMMTLVVLEAQWQESLINRQHFVNEVFFYILCSALMLFCGIIQDSN